MTTLQRRPVPPLWAALFLLTSSAACTMASDHDGDGHTSEVDCDDTDPSIYPGATEVCDDGIDQDCTAGSGTCRLDGDLAASTAGTRLLASPLGSEAGTAVTNAGDFNGDGIEDIAIGLPGDSTQAEQAGALVLLFGSTDGSPHSLTLYGTTAGARLGSSVAAVGDADGDGVGDLLVGAPGLPPTDDGSDEASGHGQGGAYLLTSLPAESGAFPEDAFLLEGGQAGDCAGTSLAAAGDVNGDGIADLLVGSPCRGSHRLFHDHIQSWMLIDGPGAAALVLGPVTADRSLQTADLTIDGSEDWDRLGTALSSLADFSGDGLPDLAVGAPDVFGAEWINPPARGQVLFVEGTHRGELAASTVEGRLVGQCCGKKLHDSLGSALSPFGAQLLVGLPDLKGFGQDGGVGVVAPNGTQTLTTSDMISIVASPPQEGTAARAGSAVASLDLDCDGQLDVALGLPSEADLGLQTGAVRVTYGPLDSYVDLANDGLHVAGPASGTQFGTAVASADLNGDGCDDLIVGAPGDGGASGGVYWFAGRGE